MSDISSRILLKPGSIYTESGFVFSSSLYHRPYLAIPADFDYLKNEHHESNSKEYSYSWFNRFDRPQQLIGHS